jgi:hypothetical protein
MSNNEWLRKNRTLLNFIREFVLLVFCAELEIGIVAGRCHILGSGAFFNMKLFTVH